MPVFSVTVDSSGAVSGIKQAQSAAVQLGNSFGEMKNKGQAGADAVATSMENLAKKALAAFSVYKGFDISRNAVLAAGKYEMLGAVTMNVANKAGYLRKEVNETVRTLERQGIAMMESTNLVSQMMRAQMSLADAEKLAGVARDSAAIGLMNTTQSFETMIHGIQTAQTEVLRTIGINVNFEQSYKKYAAAIGKSVSAMSEQEKMQARINAVKEAGINIEGSYEAALESSYKKMTSMPRYLDNIEIFAGKLGAGFFSDFINEAYDAARATEGWLRKMDEAGKLEDFGKDLASNIRSASGAVDDIAISFGVWFATTRLLIPAFKTLSYELAFLNYARQEVGLLNTATMTLGGTMGRLRGMASGAINALGGPAAIAVTALGAAAYYLWNQESAAAEYAGKHADAMRLVSNNANEAKGALDAYVKKLAEMNAEQRAFEAARLKREMNEQTGGGAAYRGIVNDITPMAAFDSRAGEIRSRLGDAAKIVLPGNIENTTIAQLKDLRDLVNRVAVEFGRTKEAAQALTTLDVLISLKQQSEAAGDAVGGIGEQAAKAAAAIQGLFSPEQAMAFTASLSDLQYKIDQIGRSKVAQGAYDMLRQLKVDTDKIELGNDGKFKAKGGVFVEQKDIDMAKQGMGCRSKARVARGL